MQSFDFHPTTRVVFGEHTVTRLGAIVQEFGSREVLLVTDVGIVKAGIPETVLGVLESASIKMHVFDGVEENPTTWHVEKATLFAREAGPIDLILGLGGGSAMDCAKGVNFLLTNGGQMEDYWGVDKATKPMLPSIGIPTTAGTGSEAQSFALISQKETHRKMACGDKKARFRTVILDPALLESVPRNVAAATGLDAISHAVESHVTARRNSVSQMFSREAWRLLEQSFEIFLADPSDSTARSQMLLGAHLAGAAIENSMLGAAHACANPLTARYGIPHGVAVGLMLTHVIQLNSQVVDHLYRDLQRSASEPVSVGERIRSLREVAGLPTQLREYPISRENLPRLAQEASTQWTAQFNPRPVNESDLLGLYEAAY